MASDTGQEAPPQQGPPHATTDVAQGDVKVYSQTPAARPVTAAGATTASINDGPGQEDETAMSTLARIKSKAGTVSLGGVSVAATVQDKTRAIALVATVALSQVCNVGSIQAIIVALPSIGRDLEIPEYSLEWVLSAYSLTFGCFLLFFGRLADIYGHRVIYLLGTTIYLAFSIACGFAPSQISLDFFRAFQGIGAAAFIPSAIGILSLTFPPGHARSLAFATFSAGAPVGAGVGAVVGGLLTQYTHPNWRSVFFFLAGLAGFTLLSGLFVVPTDVIRKDSDRSIDWLGAIVATLGLVLLVFALSQGQGASSGWKTGYIIALLIVSVLLLMLFIAWEYYLTRRRESGRKAVAPLMRTSIFKKGRFAIILTVGFFGWAGFTCVFFYATLLFQNYQHLDVVHTFIRFLPNAVVGVLICVAFGIFVSRVSAQILLTAGAVGTAVAALLFAVIPPHTTYWALGFPSLILVVFGGDMIFATCTLYCTLIANADEQALAGGIFNTVSQLANAFGLAIESVVADSVTRRKAREGGVEMGRSSTTAPPEALVKGYQAAFWTSFAFMVVCIFSCVFGLHGIGVIGQKKKTNSEGSALGSGQEDDAQGSLEKHTQSVEKQKWVEAEAPPPELGANKGMSEEGKGSVERGERREAGGSLREGTRVESPVT